MKKIFVGLLFVGAFVVSSFYIKNAQSDPPQLQVGAPAPDFELEDSAGNKFSLSANRGKVVVLEWTNPDCPYVKRHYKVETMENIARTNPNVVWAAINSTHYSSKEKNSHWSAEHQLKYPVLDDKDGKVGRLYGARTTPNLFVIDESGILRYRGAIDDDSFGVANPGRRVNYVKNALASLAAGKPIEVPDTAPYGCSVKYAS